MGEEPFSMRAWHSNIKRDFFQGSFPWNFHGTFSNNFSKGLFQKDTKGKTGNPSRERITGRTDRPISEMPDQIAHGETACITCLRMMHVQASFSSSPSAPKKRLPCIRVRKRDEALGLTTAQEPQLHTLVLKAIFTYSAPPSTRIHPGTSIATWGEKNGLSSRSTRKRPTATR